jgi:hypothetical protein
VTSVARWRSRAEGGVSTLYRQLRFQKRFDVGRTFVVGELAGFA